MFTAKEMYVEFYGVENSQGNEFQLFVTLRHYLLGGSWLRLLGSNQRPND
jgi:hypothetical protein